MNSDDQLVVTCKGVQETDSSKNNLIISDKGEATITPDAISHDESSRLDVVLPANIADELGVGVLSENVLPPKESALSFVTSTPQPAPSISKSLLKRRNSNVRTLKKLGLSVAKTTPVKRRLCREVRKLVKQVENLQQKLNHLKALSSCQNLDSLLKSVLKPTLFELVKADLRNGERKGGGKHWELDEKLIALALFKRSPHAYRHLCHFLTLPSIATLLRLLHKIPLTLGINHSVIAQVKDSIAGFHPRDKVVTLIFDEVSLKTRLLYDEFSGKIEGYKDFGNNDRISNLANHALVFIIQGMARRYKQPVAFFFVRNTTKTSRLKSLIADVVKAVQNVGLVVGATVCDQAPTNRAAVNQLQQNAQPNVLKREPFFVVNSQKIFVIFDVPHLFKCLCNYFMTSEFLEWNGKKASWKNIQQVWNMDQEHMLRNVHHLTEAHINPKGMGKMKVKYAAQVISYKTSAALKTNELLTNGIGPMAIVGAGGTADVIKDLDLLFDATNGPSKPANKKPPKIMHESVIHPVRRNVSAKSGHVEFWQKMSALLTDMRFFLWDDKKNKLFVRNPVAQKSYVQTLQAFELLWMHLKNEHDFTVLKLRQLNQDSLENLFGVIRQQGGSNDNPTCTHFIAALKTSIMTCLSSGHSNNFNCEADRSVLLCNLRSFVLRSVEDVCLNADDEESSNVNISCKQANTPGLIFDDLFCIPEDNTALASSLYDLDCQSTTYVAGYIGTKLMTEKCVSCEVSLRAVELGTQHTYTQCKEWDPDNPALFSASEALIEAVTQATDIFMRDILPDLHLVTLKCDAELKILIGVDLRFLDCPLHGSKLVDKFTQLITKLLIRTRVTHMNKDILQRDENIKATRNIAKKK